jgi:glutathione S-transferase
VPGYLGRNALWLFQPAFCAADEFEGTSSGFQSLGRRPADIDRIVSIWRDCLAAEKGPFLFGKSACMADAMFAPVVTRFVSYDVKLDSDCAAYCTAIMEMPPMREWVQAARAEPDEMVELDMEF